MTDDIRKAAEALIEDIESGTALNVRAVKTYKALKAALKPSREEVADYLDYWNKNDDFRKFPNYEQYKRFVNHAIEYLREEQDTEREQRKIT